MHAHTVRPPNHACIDPLPWRRTRTVVRSGHSCMHAFERKARKRWMDTNDHRATTIDKCACSATVGAGVCDDWCAYASPSVSVLTGSDYRSDTFFFPIWLCSLQGSAGPSQWKHRRVTVTRRNGRRMARHRCMATRRLSPSSSWRTGTGDACISSRTSATVTVDGSILILEHGPNWGGGSRKGHDKWEEVHPCRASAIENFIIWPCLVFKKVCFEIM